MSLSGDRIRDLRIKNDMTLDDVAKYLGINRQAVYKYEQGIVTNIPLDKIEKMAVLFNTTPGYIAGWTDPDPFSDPEEVAAKLREPPPGVVVPDSALFVKAMEKMTPEDVITLTDIFNRAIAKIQKDEENTR